MDEHHRLRLLRVNTIVALLLGLLLLAVSYWRVVEYPFWRDLTHEVGFALIVAVTIWSTYEFFTQSETEEQCNKRIETITRNVFFGVSKRNFPSDFIKEANVLVLDQTFMREDLHVSYTISDGEYRDRAGTCRTLSGLMPVARTLQRFFSRPVGLGAVRRRATGAVPGASRALRNFSPSPDRYRRGSNFRSREVDLGHHRRSAAA